MEARCSRCGKLLFKCSMARNIEIVCPRCKNKTVYQLFGEPREPLEHQRFKNSREPLEHQRVF